MSDIDYLPRKWADSFRRAAVASDGVRNMMLLADPDYHTVFTHFLGDALPGEWTTAKTNGTSAAVTVATSYLTCTTGTDDDGYAGQAFGLFWKGDNGLYMQSKQAIDTITTSKIEIGFTDATADAGAVLVKATPTATADDFCVLVRDTDHNTALAVASCLDAGTPVVTATSPAYAVVGGTYFTSEFRGQNDTVSVFVNKDAVGSGSMQGGDLVTPWVFAQARAISASRILTVEYLFVTGPIA